MRARQSVPEAVTRLAGRQSGVLSREQALGLGLSRKAVLRLLADDQWGTVEPGIYLTPNTSPDWLGQVWAGILVGGTESRAGDLTAAALHGLVDEQQLPVQILVPNGTRRAERPWVAFRQEAHLVRAASGRAEPPRTRIEDTVLDLCASGSEDACVQWVTTAVQRRLTTSAALAAALGRRTRLPHRRLLSSLLSDVAAGVHSTLELRYLADVERAHALAVGARQRQRPGGSEYLDVLYEEFGLVVELDGRLGHAGSADVFRDRRRDNRHTAVGLRTLRFGWQDVMREPCAVATQVAEVLIGLGWPGYPARCLRCR